MGIQWDSEGGLGPLRPPIEPAIALHAMVAVDAVVLGAGRISWEVLRGFYERVLGLRFVEQDEKGMRFAYLQRRLELRRDAPAGRAAFLVRLFDQAVIQLRECGSHCETLHTDGGLTRTAVGRDPAGNWIYLLETRPF